MGRFKNHLGNSDRGATASSSGGASGGPGPSGGGGGSGNDPTNGHGHDQQQQAPRRGGSKHRDSTNGSKQTTTTTLTHPLDGPADYRHSHRNGSAGAAGNGSAVGAASANGTAVNGHAGHWRLARVFNENDEALINRKLPKELLLRIFSHLDVISLCRCAQVSKAWNVLALDGSNWQRVDLFDFQVDIEGIVVENLARRSVIFEWFFQIHPVIVVCNSLFHVM